MVKTKQRGISPKILADLIVSVVAFAALAMLGLDLDQDPVLAAAIAKAAGTIAGVIAGPGDVVREHVPPDPTR